MTRINVYRYDDEDGKILDGWFDPDKAENIVDDTRWDGNNSVSVHASDRFAHEALYRTAKGRWVLHRWSQRQGSVPTYEFITDDTARTWLLKNDSDDIVEKYFGEIEEERGPGRPEVGKPINVRLGDDLLARVDERAKAEGKTRADMLRDLVSQAIG
jgi:hypothetical protein